MIKKKASKNDLWQGQITERVDNLVKTADELKEAVKEGFKNISVEVKEIKTSVDAKFDKHNKHHFQQEKKYVKWFLILAALAIGGLMANPENAHFVWSLIIRAFVGIF